MNQIITAFITDQNAFRTDTLTVFTILVLAFLGAFIWSLAIVRDW